MAYVHPEVGSLPGKPAFGNQQCVVMVECYSKAPAPANPKWKQGIRVKGATTIAKGTAIATFVGGVCPNKPSGNHAALYVSRDKAGVWVVDQYFGSHGIQAVAALQRLQP
jgi:hypothetical protein